MVKKYSTTTTLIIVESPAKCKKIEEYLGPGYKCVASFGHLTELSGLKSIDITNKFNPTYTLIENTLKKKQLDMLKRESKNADEIIIACDADREGEGISFHLCQLLKLDISKTKRIVFNEVTETALRNAIKNPQRIDMNLVHAQQARQILDLLVGFKISPILWKCFKKDKDNALSAGRCQTPALKLIYENDQEIKNAELKKVYNTTGYFTNMNLAFELNKQFESEDDITDFLDGSTSFNHIYNCSSPVKTSKKSPEPFTTSRLQQVASNELHFSPKETMRLCQTLYEAGYITYMRTDSKKYSADFIQSIKTHIINTYDATYISPQIDELSSANNIKNSKSNKKENKNSDKQDFSQEAHEAIRPTNILLKDIPDGVEKMENKERRLYKLIWTNTLESCMAPATFNKIVATVSAFQNNKFTYTSEQIIFPGWLAVESKYQNVNTEYQYLQIIKQNEKIPYKKFISRISIKGSKLHFTEARLIQLLEEKGIGRPSTFASLVDKIQERGYVKKQDIKGNEIKCIDYELENGEIYEIETKREFGNEKTKLVMQPLGIIVIEFLEKFFSELFNYDYTKEMEDSLDKIAKGDLTWYDLCEICNKQIDNLITQLTDKGMNAKLEIKLDDENTYLIGKYGPVIKHIEKIDDKEATSFKPIRQDIEIDINKLKNGDYKVEDIIDKEKNKSKPESVKSVVLGLYEGKEVILRKGKFGLYLTWDKLSKSLKEFGNRPMENISLDEVTQYLEQGSNIIREISSNMSIRRGPKGDYLFYKTSKMKKPQFYDIQTFLDTDYKTCNISILKSWIKEKYNILL
jgi:DNA topoisomerase-1